MTSTLLSTASQPLWRTLPGVHRVRRERNGNFYEYWYAWRGGPKILSAKANSARLLDREVGRLEPEAKRLALNAVRTPTHDEHLTLYGLVTRYLRYMEDSSAAPRTKADRKKHLDIVRDELGEMEVRLLAHPKARPTLLNWRDQRSATPRTADAILGDLSLVLNWAMDRGEIDRNPLANFPRIYQVDRSEVIWESHHLAALLEVAEVEIAHAVRLVAVTGLRKGDLIALRWDEVLDSAIVRQTNKSRKKTTAAVPITEDVREVLDMIPRRGDTVLTNSKGRPWKAPGNGLDTAFQDAKRAAGSDVAHLRFHDLRGTAATNFILRGISLEDVAEIMGWKTEQVREIARRYVSGRALVEGMLVRIAKAKVSL